MKCFRVLPILLTLSLLCACAAPQSDGGANAQQPPPSPAVSTQQPVPPGPAVSAEESELFSSQPVSDGADRAEFTVIRQDNSVLDQEGQALAILYYDQVELSGDSVAFARINRALDQERKSFLSQEKHDEFAYCCEMMQTSVSPENPLFNTAAAQVTQNGDGVLSILLTEEWYQGGVYNQNYYGLTYDLRTGETAGLARLLDRDEDTLAGELAEIAKATLYAGDDVLPGSLDDLDEYALEDFDFHIRDGEVILTFPTYALACGAAGAFTVPTGLMLPA